MHLALGGTRADGAPGNQVGDVLGRDHVEEFGAGRHAQLIHVPQQLARQAQAVVDREGAIQVRVVDQALPAYRGARLLEVHAHHHQQVVLEAVSLALEATGIFHRRFVVVDRARPDHHEQAVVGTKQDTVDRATRLESGFRGPGGGGEFPQHMGWRGQFLDLLDTDIIDMDFRGGGHGESCGRS